MTPALPEGYTELADKAACERIVRLLVALGNDNVCVAAREFEGHYSVECFSRRSDHGWLPIGPTHHGNTEHDALAIAEADVREVVRSYSGELREAAEAALNSVKQQLVEVAARLAKADALDSALKER